MAPIFGSVSITGLNFRDTRLARQTAAVGVNWISGGVYQGAASTYESFDSDLFRVSLKRTLEDWGLARSVVPDAPVRIEGRFTTDRGYGLAGIAMLIWNSITLTGVFGSPYVGWGTAQVELRVYEHDELVARYHGNERVKWRSSLYEAKTTHMQAPYVAVRYALLDAVDQMVSDPPKLQHSRTPSFREPAAQRSRRLPRSGCETDAFGRCTQPANQRAR